MSNDEWISSKTAQDRLGRSERQIRNYVTAGKLRTRFRGRRIEYSSADIDALASELHTDDRPRVPEQQIVPAGELLTHIRELESQLAETMLQVGYLRAALEERTLQRDEAKQAQRLLVDKEREVIQLQSQLNSVKGSSRLKTVGLIALTILVIVVIVGAYLIIR